MARPVAPLNRLAAAAALLVGAAAVAGLVLLRDEETTERGPASSGSRVTYDVVDVATGARTTEVVEVDRPQASRRLLPGGGGSATTDSGVFDRVDGHWRQLAVVPPGEPGQDLQLTASLAWAETVGFARRDGAGTVAGTGCTWWLTREPLDVGSVAAATATDRARSCVDETGRLLADSWRAGGRDLRTRTATRVERLARLHPFDGSTPAPIVAGLTTTAVEQLPTPTADLVVDPVLPGAVVTAAVRYLDVAPGSTEIVRRVQRTVLSRDGALVVLDQVREQQAVAPRGDAEVELGPLGRGRVRATGGGLVVEVAVGTGLVRVRSGLPLADVTAWMRTLQPV